MELDIPPIELHASTQTDIRTLARAKFLDQAGFSQLVLARELNLQEIRAIADETDAAIEFFIHGALCVAFSGQCNISHAQTGRSANRGDCSQACRLPYTLKDEKGGVVAFEKHLLSMKDNNQSANLRALVDAGVRSFKIEGRYKDMGYVKNITAYYRQRLDDILEDRPDRPRLQRPHRALLPARPGQDLPPRQHRLLRQRPQDRHRRLRLADLHRPAGGRGGKVGKRDLQVVTHEPLSNGDGLNVLVKREVVGSAPTSPSPRASSKKTARSATATASSRTRCPGLHQLRPNHPLAATSTTTGSRRCKRPRRAPHRPVVGRAPA
jgi:putative protease